MILYYIIRSDGDDVEAAPDCIQTDNHNDHSGQSDKMADTMTSTDGDGPILDHGLKFRYSEISL